MAPDRLLRILHVVDTLGFGGLERVVADLARAQAAHGHRVAVFAIEDRDPPPGAGAPGFRGELERAGIPVIAGDKRGRLDRGVWRRLRRAALGEGAEATGVQIVHSHNFVPSYYAAAAAIGHGPGTALVNTCHNMGTRLSNRRLRWLYRWSLGRTQRVALVGQQVRRTLVGGGVVAPWQAEVVLNGIPLERHASPSGARAAARAALGVPEDALLLGSVGRLVALKNHALLIDALSGLLPAHPALHAAIVGDGPLMGELRERIASHGLAERVHLAGARGDVPALLPAFDAFVLPSRTEGLSIALLEAAAAGLPIVATDVGGNAEVVQDGRSGRLVPSDDAAALQAALDELLRSPGLRRAMGDAGRGWVRNRASIDAMRRSYDGVYARALEDAGHAALLTERRRPAGT